MIQRVGTLSIEEPDATENDINGSQVLGEGLP